MWNNNWIISHYYYNIIVLVVNLYRKQSSGPTFVCRRNRGAPFIGEHGRTGNPRGNVELANGFDRGNDAMILRSESARRRTCAGNGFLLVFLYFITIADALIFNNNASKRIYNIMFISKFLIHSYRTNNGTYEPTSWINITNSTHKIINMYSVRSEFDF